jgi:hypothetical protein
VTNLSVKIRGDCGISIERNAEILKIRMDTVYFKTVSDGIRSRGSVIRNVINCDDIMSLRNRILSLRGIDAYSAGYWQVLSIEGSEEIDCFTAIQDLLSMTPIPGSKESPLILVSPESQTPVASEPGNKRKRTLPSEFPVFTTPVAAPQVSEELDGKFIRVPAELARLIYNEKRDALRTEPEAAPALPVDLILYKRQNLVAQLAFLEETVIVSGKRGWVIGPPGTGKSVASFAFARRKASEGWLITWITVFDGYPEYCVRFSGNTYSTCEIERDAPFSELLNPSIDSVKHVVFLDGYRKGITAADDYLNDCTRWWRSTKATASRRLVVVTSMAARKDRSASPEGPFEDQFQEESWLESELLAACENQALLQSVLPYLDAPTSSPSPSVGERISAKFHYAGGSARFMFRMKTREVTKSISMAISEVPNLHMYINGEIADRNIGAVNRLLGSYRRKGDRRIVFVISRYAALELAIVAGPEGVRAMRNSLRAYKNPSMDGWLFEMWFFAIVKTDGLRLKPKQGKALKWAVPEDDFESIIPPAGSLFKSDVDVWIKPDRWNQAGFDAVHIKPKEKTVEFFQVTRGATHDLNLTHFADCLSNLTRRQKFTILIYMVLPMENLRTFKLCQVSGENEMLRFNQSWSIAEHLKILGIEDR